MVNLVRVVVGLDEHRCCVLATTTKRATGGVRHDELMFSYDVLVIGGGIAGASIGYELASDRSVGLLDMEATLAHHTTGRSAAMFLESYGGRTIRLLTSASRAFLHDPPDGFGRPVLAELPMVWVAPHGRGDDLRALHAAVSEFVPAVEMLSAADAADASKVVRREWVEAGMVEPDASEIDVAALHGGFVSGLRARGGVVHTSAGVVSLQRLGDVWQVTDRSGAVYSAPVVVNAAGSWCDQVAAMAGAAPVGIHPLRRTVFTVAAPPMIDSRGVPLVADLDGTFYLKPEGQHLLCSPADEVPSEPCDARPEELDIARAIDTINSATILDIRHVRSSWAGLRNFVVDRSPVVCFDDVVAGFFWFVGQGGYGIQMSPALAAAGAELIRSGVLPTALIDRGLVASSLDRRRLVGLSGLAH